VEERAAFQAAQPALNVDDLVFIDEAGVNLSMTTAYGRAFRGERVVEHRPSIRTAKTSLVGAITVEGLVSIGMVAGSYNAVRFREWLTGDLLPKLPRGKVLVWDNVKFHYNQEVLAAVEAAGCSVLKMPPYSPDLNPIEECWSKLKHFVRKAKARTQGALHSAVAAAREQLRPPDFVGWVGHAGYPVPGSI
jgi:transposase